MHLNPAEASHLLPSNPLLLNNPLKSKLLSLHPKIPNLPKTLLNLQPNLKLPNLLQRKLQRLLPKDHLTQVHGLSKAMLKKSSLKLKTHSTSSILIKEDQLTPKVLFYSNLELKAAMVSLGFDSKNGSIFQMIADLDSDGNGNIDFPEFFNLMTTKISDKNSRAQYAKVFAMFDDDKKGYLTAENLVRVAETLGEQITIAEIGEMIKRADLDTDSVVSEEEFYAIMTRKI
jgi:centrin-1